MTSVDFAQAQQRILARRALHESRTAALETSRRASHAASLARLPAPLRSLAFSGYSIWDTISGREGTRPAFRVGQVDAELLDEELLSLLQGQVGEATKYYGAHIRDEWSAEIMLALRAALFKLSIWDHNASYGASLQGLRYTDARATGPEALSRPPPQRWQKSLYGVVTVGGRYAWAKWEDWLVDREGGYEEPSAAVRRLSRLSGFLGTTHSIAAFTSFLVFLYNGKYRTLLDRLLRLRLAPTTSQVSREVSFEYLNRQLVWHAFTEFLLFLLPLVGISRWRRWLSRAWRKTKNLLSFRHSTDTSDEDNAKTGGELGFLPERTCAICYADQNPTATGAGTEQALAASAVLGSGGVVGSAQTDVTNPYECVPCGCVYCFVCLAQRIEGEEGEGWTCLRCGETVGECRPWAGDVCLERGEGEGKKAGSVKSVGFADEKEGQDRGEGKEMRDVDPMPVEDDEVEGSSRDERDAENVTSESAEWARIGSVSEADDQQDDERATP
ncbi:putative peroxisome biosynthesis protein [Cryomyces antarcticus]